MSLVSPTCVAKAEFAFELSAFSTSDKPPPTTCNKRKRKPADVDMDQANHTDEEDEEDCGTTVGTGMWTKDEHARFLEAIKLYANGPWKFVAAYVATRTVRQTMTHAQKYRQKAARRLRGLRTKQALMRMHYGHRLTEESLVQERMRALAAQVDVAAGSASQQQPLYSPAARPDSMLALLKGPNPETTHLKKSPRGRKVTAAASTTRHRASKTSKASPKTTTETPSSSTIATTPPSVFSQTTAETVDAAIFDVNELLAADLEIIDDLSEAPSLEECADMLYDLLCC